MFRAIVLWERSQGVRIEEVERRFGIQGLEGIEERWRDELLWLLSGLAKLLDVRTFYYHLKENCEADFGRVKRVKQRLRQIEWQVYDLQEQLKYCSPLGSLLCEIRRLAPQRKTRVGFQSVRRLEESGISSLKGLMSLGVEDMVKLGIRRGLAEQVKAYLRQRMQ
jgi:tRNA(Ile)-lysidine synthase TilS/MesJ